MPSRFSPLVVICVVTAGLFAADPPAMPPARVFDFSTPAATLDEILTEFQKQTGVAIDRSRADTARKVRLKCAKAPFWDAVENIARAADHRLQFLDDGRTLQLVGGGDKHYRAAPMCVSGPFRIAVQKVAADLDFAVVDSHTVVTLAVNWEPGQAVFLIDPKLSRVRGKDDTGRELRCADSGGGRLRTAGQRIEVPLRFANVPRSVNNIAELVGQFDVVGSAGMIEVEFPKPAAAAESIAVQRDGVVVKLRTDFKAQTGLWTARIEIEQPADSPALESFEASAWLVDNRVWLTSSGRKKKLECNGGYEIVAQTSRSAVIHYRFTDEANLSLGKPEDWTLHVRTPSRLLIAPVKYRIENIPLP